jgi:hypothetical protein
MRLRADDCSGQSAAGADGPQSHQDCADGSATSTGQFASTGSAAVHLGNSVPLMMDHGCAGVVACVSLVGWPARTGRARERPPAHNGEEPWITYGHDV